MLHLVTGGSGSGKSAFAEDLICRLHREKVGQAPGPLLYIATMMPYGEETEQKIRHHRLMRREKGFETIECYMGIHALAKEGGPAYEASIRGARPCILLECMSNLTANEMYSPDGAGVRTAEEVVRGIELLHTMCRNLVVVTNDVFREGEPSCEMLRYRETLARINARLARMGASVTEVVCGIPAEIKGNTYGKGTGVHMILVTGGACQGKTAYAERAYGVKSWIDGGSCGFDEIYACTAIRHFERLVRRMMEAGVCTSDLAGKLAAQNPDVVITADEIGCGLVPVDAFERAYREQAGRICTELAQIAERVDRVVCGIGMTIKGGER
ncbi:bifunctional adenosylcobinamide kinase/adenosylcobinamide-phosphate guanylyltransferase [Extibacter muris]|uniref:bifunctional adenosylcobinamide kinase/adenosylcobinamide-phosphate guanylyltransferase n=1 Tax=Extibacter muris TaxID=1796622 RepID=UPI001D0627A1|nr:bifunctional adenosylcobinamide kinase/adenosylcobinamide-phosphate guanylyltransferase [Extibacter muris]MCB6200793.1 bifunctional adenosylcobinamide kinase/adenosylcobinamide-phosphate guanylyltransferase [Extibacter muris]MCQ4662124.1 bifunctional adenosylcobinamide kinase/adenosylcobinamide-phosphate guanylyltransferase [Extibacter muris]MCQ4691963.1 bifunctional adenosylcobinamide kinase/adenosylcobinamide-phosphate guanylyltransferase [Extibacter muris]